MPQLLSAGYDSTRRRVTELVRELDGSDLARRVPACPVWTVHDLLAHMTGIPEELAAGRYPADDLQAWLDAIVESRRAVPVDELLVGWEASAKALEDLIDGSGHMLVDAVSHEHDLRGAVGRPGAKGTPEVRAAVQLLLDILEPGITQAALGALVIAAGGVTWASHVAKPGCIIQADPWEAIRILQSRRTAAEVRAVPHTGDIEAYLPVLDAHSPLPAESLGES